MPENYVCGKCGKVAKTKQALERHAAYHEDERPFSCEVCLQRFKNSDDRGKHYRRLKKDGKFNIACTVCHKHFKTDEILQKHMEMLGCNAAASVPDTTHSVATSGSSCDDGSASRDKGRDSPGVGISCTCKICEAEFTSAKSLKKHYKEVHNDTKRQVCIQCGQTLSSKDSLARHFSIFHQTSFPFSCDLCNQKFKIKESLCRHIKFVHQDGGYQCPECSRVFTQPVNLKKHQAVHSTQKEFSCKVCGREFRWKQALQKHELLHGTQDKSSNINEDVMDEGIDDLEVDFVDAESSEGRKSDFNNMNDRTIVEDVTDKDIGRKIREETERDIGIKLNYIDTSEEKRSDSTLMEKQSYVGGLKALSVTTEKCSHTPSFLNGGETDSCSGRQDFCHSYPKKKVHDEYDFEEEIENSLQGRYDYTSIRKKQAPVPKRTLNDNPDLKTDKKKKMKMTKDLFVQDENLSHVLESNDKFETGDSLCQNESFSSCNGNPESEILSSKLETVNTEHTDAHTCNTDNDIPSGEKSMEPEKLEEQFDSESEIHKLKFSSLTSCPTSKTLDAPKLVFKPSSIQNLMARSDASQTENRKDSVEKNNGSVPVNSRKPLFVFPVTSGALHTKLHNPFIIQRSTLDAVVPCSSHSISSVNKADKTVAISSEEKSTSVIAKRGHNVPTGKFSLVKHMLSLQNEENFDKAMFENPLYSKPADIKDFELMVERHKVVDKSSNNSIQYDLSAKHNIPIHWLGMSIAKRKPVDKKYSDKGKHTNEVEVLQKMHQDSESKEIQITNNCTVAVSKENVSQDAIPVFESSTESCHQNETENENDSSERDRQGHRGFQAIKNLVAQKHKNDSGYESQNEKSVLSNPFDYQNKQFQDDRLTITSQISSSQMSYTKNESMPFHKLVHSSEAYRNSNTVIFNSTTAAGIDTYRNKLNLDKPAHCRRHYSADSTSKSHSNVSTDFPFPRTFSGSSFESVVSPSFSRSLSIPSCSDYDRYFPKQQPWVIQSTVSPESHVSRKLRHTSTELYGSVQDISPRNCNEGLNLLFYDAQRHKKTEITHENIEHVSNRDGLLLINKNIAQLQRLNCTGIDRNQMKHNQFDKMRPIETDTNCHETYQKHSREITHDTRAHGVTFTCGPLNHSSNIQARDTDNDETAKFDAYTMIDSPCEATYTHSAVSVSTSHPDEKACSAVGRHQEYRKCQNSEMALLPETVRNSNRNADFKKTNGSNFEVQGAQNNLSGNTRTWQHLGQKVSELSPLDMFKIVQEGKDKEYDNIESLLGAYS